MSTDKSLTENDKRRLAEYLIQEVIDGISGRDGVDLIDTTPSRSIFTGVLHPLKQSDLINSAQGLGGGEAPLGTSIGLDFKVRPFDSQAQIKLKISASWSFYYANFPTFTQTKSTIESILSIKKLEDSTKDFVEESPIDEFENSDEDDIGNSVDDDEEEKQVAVTEGRAILPRVFHRVDVKPEAIEVQIPLNARQKVKPSQNILIEAIENTRQIINGDPKIWKHLDEPKKHERSLGDSSVLGSEETFEKAIKNVLGEKVKLPEWLVSLEVESEPDPVDVTTKRIRILLANETQEVYSDDIDSGLIERSIFDASLKVEIEGGDIIPFDFLLAPHDYRGKPQMSAKGINCSAVLDVPNELRTETLPIFEQPFYKTRESMDVKFEELIGDDFSVKLYDIANEMDIYHERWNEFLNEEAQQSFSESELKACESDKLEFYKEIQQYRLGIEVLKRDPLLAKAFNLMNQAFLERSRTKKSKISTWRLFQIGFIVSQLPSLAVRELTKSDDEYFNSVSSTLDEVGVLWFPTGGGKTEAYLGLIATALLYDRLRGKTRGTTAWMRFPLRMLSLQQLERLAQVIAALNELRETESSIRTGDPFGIGYYVGSGVTPNAINDQEMHRLETTPNLRESFKLLRRCPYCGSDVKIEAIRQSWRLAHVCSNPDCFTNKTNSLGYYNGSIPISVVDTEIYRFLPSILIGTVDKLAIAGFNRNFAHLITGANQQCNDHGYASYDQCIERWNANCNVKKKDFINLTPIKDPGPSLIIQDEFHLLKSELGVFTNRLIIKWSCYRAA